MQFEKLKKDNHKKIIIGGMILVGVLSAIVLTTTRAKYRTTQSINIVNGTINYKPYDLKVLAMYKQKEGSTCTEDSCYQEITGRMPSSGYAINESKSYCTLDGINKDTEVRLYTNSNLEHVMANLAKNEKCKLYFDKKICNGIACENVLAGITPKTTAPTYSSSTTIDEGVYKISDGMYGGDSYVWRGAVNNNWVKFANLYWRIIRINGDGTIRLIYTGNSSLSNVTVDANGITATGTGTQIQTSKYNSSRDRSEYVGYTYTTRYQRTTGGTNSTIKGIVDNWYSNNIGNNSTYLSKVADGKFCNDRNTASGYAWASQPSSTLYYAARGRLESSKAPTLSCSNAGDVYTLKAGLITIDEVSMAGGLYGGSGANSNYYLYTNQSYWTMSPYGFLSSLALVFYVHSAGYLSNQGVSDTYGVRPVINLKADTVFASGGTGTKNNPYKVA